MTMACSRLADADLRTRPEDCILDAVIGMEALLLAGAPERKGELSLQFSLNYAMLFPPEHRVDAYKVAHDLYGLRSTIAHGRPTPKGKTVSARVELSEAGRRATAALRTIIVRFLPMDGSPYKDREFWLRKYFGLPEPDRGS